MSKAAQPLLSVVTVTFQDTPGLRRTLTSLKKLANDCQGEAEFIVVDGGDGGTLESLAFEFPWASIRSEPDSGIYDGMNKGITRSRGSFVWFLNGGDQCEVDWADLANELSRDASQIVLCAYSLQIGSRVRMKRPRPSTYIWHALPTSHQAIFFPGDGARASPYDLRFKMSADYQFTAQMLANGRTARRSQLVAARFHMGGHSFQHAERVAIEAEVVQREVLSSPTVLRLVSRARHWASRTVRRVQAHVWSART